ncbi:MAG: rod shape-determining protein [Clostridia bacterium]|nr:rod shape-determining protein [Clostridia bacterium]
MSKKDIGIDLGTANTLVYLKSKGIVLNEPSVVAINSRGKVVAVGTDAKKMLGRSHSDIKVIRPLKNGVIANFEAAGIMLEHFIKKVLGKQKGAKPRAVICVPTGITEVERKAVEEAALKVGVRNVYILEEPMAAAIGAGIDVDAPMGSMIVDIGGGTSEVAVISLGGIVSWKTIRTAGDSYDEAISSYLRKKYGIQSGRHNAESLKIKIGTVQKRSDPQKEIISGRNAVSGMPCSSYVTDEDIKNALVPQVSEVIDAIGSVLEQTPPELSSDILKSGIVLTGGGALLDGLSTVICNSINIPVRIADNPLECVVNGAGQIIESNFNQEFFNIRK